MADSDLPVSLYDVDDARVLDELAIDREGIPGLSLMTRAGEAALRELRRRWPAVERITVVCGLGNNAGDGYVVARAADAAGCAVRVVQVGSTDTLSQDARACYDSMVAAGLTPESELAAIDTADVLVDALFGIGLMRDVEGRFAEAVEQMNLAAAPVLSIDIPSGIDGSSGRRMGTAVRAAVTVTFIGVKRGLLTGDGPEHAGEIVFDDLGVPAAVYDSVRPRTSLVDMRYVQERLRPRPRTAHKGHHGHVLVIGGAPGYSGAVRLAGEAAARVGAGLVSIATHPEVAAMVNAARPELMVHAVARAGQLEALLARATVIAIGPGLGQSDWAMALFAMVLNGKLPLVVDADALNLLAADPERRNDWVLTPHPGEAARLLHTTTAEIHKNRFVAAAKVHEVYGGSVVLKGAGSIISDSNSAVLRGGNPGMASGGMGDVLTGVIAALMAQGWAPAEAARLGACVHATAADRAADDGGERGLLASDLMPYLRTLVN